MCIPVATLVGDNIKHASASLLSPGAHGHSGDGDFFKLKSNLKKRKFSMWEDLQVP